MQENNVDETKGFCGNPSGSANGLLNHTITLSGPHLCFAQSQSQDCAILGWATKAQIYSLCRTTLELHKSKVCAQHIYIYISSSVM